MKKIILALLLPICVVIFFLVITRKPPDKIINNPAIVSPSVYIFLGDTGTGNDNQYQIGLQAAKYCQDKNCQAVFIAGDVIYDKGVDDVSDPQFKTKFIDPYLSLNLPFYIAFGNHDYLGCTQCYLDYSQYSNKWKMPASYYYLDIDENVTFYVLDTVKFDDLQQKWLEEKLGQASKKWNIVIGHNPLKTNEVIHRNDIWQQKKALLDTLCNKADVYITGHSHILEDVGNLSNCQVRQLISGSGGAYSRTVIKPNDDLFYLEDNGFLSLSIWKEKIELSFVDKTGKIVYTNTISK